MFKVVKDCLFDPVRDPPMGIKDKTGRYYFLTGETDEERRAAVVAFNALRPEEKTRLRVQDDDRITYAIVEMSREEADTELVEDPLDFFRYDMGATILRSTSSTLRTRRAGRRGRTSSHRRKHVHTRHRSR